MIKKNKITSLAILRGFAVIAVCFCHFSKPINNANALPGIFKWIEENGKYGLQIFFVISGFIIPYSLEKARYQAGDYFKFLYKRFLRLHPPYLAALVITLFIAEASYRSRHLPNPENLYTVIQSFFYLHAPADNPVFWSLRIEAEYYLFIGLYFILLKKFPLLSTALGIPMLVLMGQTFLTDHVGLLAFINFFMIGTTAFLIYSKTSRPWLELSVLLAILIFSSFFYEAGAVLVSAITVLAILYFRKTFHSLAEQPGELSYSLYLLHFPIGIKFMNLVMRYTGTAYIIPVFLGAFIISYGCAYMFWRLIEKPCMKLSNKVRYGIPKSAELTVPVPLNNN